MELARVLTIEVEVGQEVVEGQILAKLDTSAIDAEIAVAKADRAKLEAEMLAEQALVLERLETDVEALQRTLALQKEEQLKVNAEAQIIREELGRKRKLVADKQAVLDDLTSLDLRQAAVSALVAEKPNTVGLLAKQIKAAEERRKRVTLESSAAALRIDADLGLAQKKQEQLELRRAGYVLRATHAGRVVSLDKRPGEVAQAGDPVVRLVSASERVVACVPEGVALGVREGDMAKLWVRGQKGAPLLGKTISLGPTVAELPQRCWRNPRIPQWGREITITLETPVELCAGQAFDIALQASTTPPPVPAALTAPPSTPLGNAPGTMQGASAPRLMTVPQALVSRSHFEPSGVVVIPSESRYLVISDDTGREGDEGAPWLFSMSPAGVIDPSPLVIEGIEEINDIEAVTLGDAGEAYLLSSQSYSKKGKRKKSRTALLRLKKEGNGFRVNGEAHLAEIIDSSPDHGASLGLADGTRSLDLEGMTFHNGELYLGVKAPLNQQKEAMIWRIAKPSAFFEGKQIDAKRAEILPFSSVRLDVDLSGSVVDGGISDMMFLPDGALVLSATPSIAEGEAGALFRVDKPQGPTLTPLLLARFPNLKPEGITLSLLSKEKLLIVFDAGAATPSFAEVAWSP